MTDTLDLIPPHTNPSDYSEDTIVSRFGRWVALVPDKLAVVTDESSLTYRALDLRASRIASVLVSLPSRHDRPIVLFIKEEAARIAAMIGVLKAERIFITVAPNSPEGWVSQVIEDAGAAHIIADSSTRSVAERAATDGVSVLYIEQLNQSEELFVVDRKASPDEPAYIVYTSGSTGRPKGVVQSHRRLIRRSDMWDVVFGRGHSDRSANSRPGGVSAWVTLALVPLLTGGCLFPFDFQRHGLQKFTAWIIANRITAISLSGSLLRTWLTSLPENLRLPSLRFIHAGSEKLYGQDVVRTARHLQGDWRILHTLASTETGLIAAQLFTPSHLPEAGIVAVGRPLEGIEVSIEDQYGTLVPPDTVGEIVVRSRFLAQAYWNNPELTAKVFEADPLDSAIRIYRTGDLGRWRSDGMLEHMGRKGRRIRVRGFNIEPAEVESELMRQPGVADAVVLPHKDGTDEASLIGYVVAPLNTSASAIRDGLAKRLPSHMVPSQVVVLDSFPVASSGKLDRKALPPPQEGRTAFRAPSDHTERTLASIWGDILNLPSIGIDDDFYDLGGTSLQAFLIFARIAAKFSRDLPPTTMMRAPTVAKQAELLRRSETDVPPTLMPFRTTGALFPLFVVHARFGDIGYARELARNLKSDRPVYGFQPPALDGSHRIPRTLEAIAAGYLADLRKVQPNGPYYLTGHSWGGRLALEMAQQLMRQGEHVAFLGLIDTSYHATYGMPSESAVARMKRHVKALRYPGIGSYLSNGVTRTAIHYMRLSTAIVRHLPNSIRLQLGRPVPYLRRPNFYDHIYQAATRRYTVRPYTGSITMFASQGKSEEQRTQWSGVALGGLTIREIPAGHVDMVGPPYSAILAAAFDECLDLISP